MTLGAWTPDAPDAGIIESPSAAIAAAQPAFDPESLDHFDGADVCGAAIVLVMPPSAAEQSWTRVELRCGEDAGHDPALPHRADMVWGAAEGLPDNPQCGECADVGVTGDGEPCSACEAGERFREAVALRQANRGD